MASSFDRWEKDPFFSAAEEVQESADRMESTYRTWIHAKQDTSSIWNAEELRRDVQTALGTTKWQLEELERAVKSSYFNNSADDARDRHWEFITAVNDQISKIERSLGETSSLGKIPSPWAHLDEGECNELALFLSGPSLAEDSTSTAVSSVTAKAHEMDNKPLLPECSMDSHPSTGCNSRETTGEKMHGHRRTASAGADIGTWKISVADCCCLETSPIAKPDLPPRKVPSLSGFLNTMGSASKLKWSKNGFRKLKITDWHQDANDSHLQSPSPSRGTTASCGKTKSCLDGCEDCYNKQLYGWYGAMQRQLQRSQYQMQYSRPFQVTFWVILFCCLLVFLAIRAI